MFRIESRVRTFFCFLVLLSIAVSAVPAHAQDFVASDDIAGGSSVFVFRKSRKVPQEKAAGRPSRAGGGKVVNHTRIPTELAATRRKRATSTKVNQTQVAKNRPPVRKPPAAATAAALVAKADDQLEAKQIDLAIATYRQALKSEPGNAAAKAGLSDALAAKGIEVAGDTNSSAAILYLEEATTLDPKNDVAFAKLGEVYDANNNNAKALSSYEKAAAINPELTAVYVPMGVRYVESGEIAKAEAAAQNAERRGVTDAGLYNLKGMVLYKQNKNTEALASFEKALSLEGRNATAKYYRAAVLDRMNQPDQSIAAYRETVVIEPAYSPAWFDLGVAYYNRGDYQNAVNAYKEAIRVDPNFYEAHFNLASTYRQLERYPEANAEYKLAEVGIKDDPDLYSEWGYCLGKTGEWDKSVARLEQARMLSPQAVDDTNVGWGYYNSAQADKQKKDDAAANAKLQKGRESLQAAVQKDPKLEAAYMNLGSTNNSLGDYQAAVTALNVALSLHSDWTIALNQLGVGYRGLNNLQMALTQFNRVVSLDGNNVAGLYNLGSAQYASGDKKGAKKTQARLNKLNPALANQLGNILAGKVVEAGTQEIKKKLPGIPRIPY